MNLTEHEGRALFSRYGIDVPRGFLVSAGANTEEITQAMESMTDVNRFALKAQIKAGKRGKSGGIVFADKGEVAKKAGGLFGKTINREKVERVLVVEALNVEREYYLSIAVDRFEKCPVMIFSTEGGIDIEETAASSPAKIAKIYLRDGESFPEKEIIGAIERLGVKSPADKGAVATGNIEIARNLFKLFIAEDCLLAEINPLILTKDGRLFAADAKITLDDNANFRHPENPELAEKSMSVPEKEAADAGLSYVELEGNLAIIGNGAGLVMATLDAVHDFGARPANFCDAGGGATKEMIEKALEIVLHNKSVMGIFINVFGGITHCNLVAEGITNHFRNNKSSLPVTVRMVGTNEKEGRDILKNAGIESFSGFKDAAKMAAGSVK